MARSYLQFYHLNTIYIQAYIAYTNTYSCIHIISYCTDTLFVFIPELDLLQLSSNQIHINLKGALRNILFIQRLSQNHYNKSNSISISYGQKLIINQKEFVDYLLLLTELNYGQQL